MKVGLGWRGYQPKRAKISADSVRELELIVAEKEKNDWKLVSRFVKESNEYRMKQSPNRKDRYEYAEKWSCMMEFVREEKIV
jgi:aspartyl/asparaginyl beta-hydroxylase (cupin superfamily)